MDSTIFIFSIVTDLVDLFVIFNLVNRFVNKLHGNS